MNVQNELEVANRLAQILIDRRDFSEITVGNLKMVKMVLSKTKFGILGLVKAYNRDNDNYTYYHGICVGDSFRDDFLMIVEYGRRVNLEMINRLIKVE